MAVELDIDSQSWECNDLVDRSRQGVAHGYGRVMVRLDVVNLRGCVFGFVLGDVLMPFDMCP